MKVNCAFNPPGKSICYASCAVYGILAFKDHSRARSGQWWPKRYRGRSVAGRLKCPPDGLGLETLQLKESYLSPSWLWGWDREWPKVGRSTFWLLGRIYAVRREGLANEPPLCDALMAIWEHVNIVFTAARPYCTAPYIFDGDWSSTSGD